MHVDSFVKGIHSNGSGSKFIDWRKNCGKHGHWTRDCRGLVGGAEEGRKGDDGKRSNKGKGAGKKFHYGRNMGKYGHKSGTFWATSSTKPTETGQGSKGKKGKQVNVFVEQSKGR